MRDSFEAPRQSQRPGYPKPPPEPHCPECMCLLRRLQQDNMRRTRADAQSHGDLERVGRFLSAEEVFSICNSGCSLKYSVNSPQLTFPIISQLLYLIMSLTGTRCESSWTYHRRCFKKKMEKKRKRKKNPSPQTPTNTRTHTSLGFHFKSFTFSNISSYTSFVFKDKEGQKKKIDDSLLDPNKTPASFHSSAALQLKVLATLCEALAVMLTPVHMARRDNWPGGVATACYASLTAAIILRGHRLAVFHFFFSLIHFIPFVLYDVFSGRLHSRRSLPTGHADGRTDMLHHADGPHWGNNIADILFQNRAWDTCDLILLFRCSQQDCMQMH